MAPPTTSIPAMAAASSGEIDDPVFGSVSPASVERARLAEWTRQSPLLLGRCCSPCTPFLWTCSR